MSGEPDEAALKKREIRSYVVRGGRLTSAQQRALDEYWPVYGVAAGSEPLDLPALFGRDAPRTLEIGFGNGDNLAMLAAAHPETDFIGAEVHPPGVGHLLLKAAALRLRNLRIVQHDAVELLRDGIAPESLDTILVLFPGPVAQEAPPQAPAGQPRLCRTRAVPPEAGRHPAAGDGLDALRRMDAGSTRGRSWPAQSLRRRRVHAPRPRPPRHTL